MMIDPTDSQYDSKNYANVTKPGRYVLAASKLWQRKKNKNGKPFVQIRFSVVAGPHQHETLLESFYLNRESMWRLVSVIRAVGVTDHFDPESDEQLKRVLFYRPFVASVKSS